MELRLIVLQSILVAGHHPAGSPLQAINMVARGVQTLIGRRLTKKGGDRIQALPLHTHTHTHTHTHNTARVEVARSTAGWAPPTRRGVGSPVDGTTACTLQR
jgi:hypothetical protein